MIRRKNKFKEVYNHGLDMVATIRPGEHLPGETVLSEQLSASRTTIRAVLSRFAEEGIVDWQSRQKLILRAPKKSDYFVPEETRSTGQIIESEFMNWVLSGDVAAGTLLNESELARNFNVSTSAVREFLIRFSRFGLVVKRPLQGWELNGFTKNFALELSDVRELFELRSVEFFAAQPDGSELWRSLENVEQQHHDLLARIETDYLDFSELDNKFHRLLNSVSDNRFIDNFHDTIAIIFHYHFGWDKARELERNTIAIGEHLKIIRALKARNTAQALKHCAAHLKTARKSLLSAVKWP